MEQASPCRPLERIRVLDFTSMLSGPVCTRILADMGAEVIKIEPADGDHNRALQPVRGGLSMNFAHVNGGKKSVVLDLKTKDGREAATDLASRSDVVVENWRPGVTRRLGLDYESLKKRKSDIIYCSISGYGQTGPYADRAAYAPIVEALSGFSTAQMDLDNADKPPTCGMMLGDTMTGIWAFSAIQTALLKREWTGSGQYIDVSMLDAMLFVQMYECREAQMGKSKRRYHAPIRTADGFMIIAPITEPNFQLLAQTIEHPEWLSDPRLATNAERSEHWDLVLKLMEEWAVQRTTEDCERILLGGGVPCARFKTFAEAMVDPQVVERGSFGVIKYPGGEYKLPNVPFQMPGVTVTTHSTVPDLGEQTAQVLKEVLGYSDEEIRACGASL